LGSTEIKGRSKNRAHVEESKLVCGHLFLRCRVGWRLTYKWALQWQVEMTSIDILKL